MTSMLHAMSSGRAHRSCTPAPCAGGGSHARTLARHHAPKPFSSTAHPVSQTRIHVVTRGSSDRRGKSDNGSSGMIVAVTGATGLVGSRLTAKLASQGAQVRVLTRDADRARGKLPYANLQFAGPQEWDTAISGCTGVVNLAGCRWGPRVKQEIYDSRINTTKRIVSAINKLPKEQRPAVLVSTSAVGYYGVSTSDTFDEASRPGNDFLAHVCQDWEAEANKAEARVVILRSGIILAKNGGALGKMVPVFMMFGGGPLASGQQWMSWVHIDDAVNLIIASLQQDKMRGVYNNTAPNPVRMNEMCSTLGSVLNRPSWLPVPEFALKGLLGEGATVVADGQRVLPQNATKAGFQFKFDTVEEALTDVLR